jgi:hypothetical protein
MNKKQAANGKKNILAGLRKGLLGNKVKPMKSLQK